MTPKKGTTEYDAIVKEGLQRGDVVRFERALGENVAPTKQSDPAIAAMIATIADAITEPVGEPGEPFKRADRDSP
jgi:hypothetical protein